MFACWHHVFASQRRVPPPLRIRSFIAPQTIAPLGSTQDCCAATDPLNHDAAISMIKKQGGVFGAVSTSAALIAAMEGSSG